MAKLLYSLNALASEGAGHSHGGAGETEHLYPIIGVFAFLIIAGIASGFFINKKK